MNGFCFLGFAIVAFLLFGGTSWLQLRVFKNAQIEDDVEVVVADHVGNDNDRVKNEVTHVYVSLCGVASELRLQKLCAPLREAHIYSGASFHALDDAQFDSIARHLVWRDFLRFVRFVWNTCDEEVPSCWQSNATLWLPRVAFRALGGERRLALLACAVCALLLLIRPILSSTWISASNNDALSARANGKKKQPSLPLCNLNLSRATASVGDASAPPLPPRGTLLARIVDATVHVTDYWSYQRRKTKGNDEDSSVCDLSSFELRLCVQIDAQPSGAVGGWQGAAFGRTSLSAYDWSRYAVRVAETRWSYAQMETVFDASWWPVMLLNVRRFAKRTLWIKLRLKKEASILNLDEITLNLVDNGILQSQHGSGASAPFTITVKPANIVQSVLRTDILPIRNALLIGEVLAGKSTLVNASYRYLRCERLQYAARVGGSGGGEQRRHSLQVEELGSSSTTSSSSSSLLAKSFRLIEHFAKRYAPLPLRLIDTIGIAQNEESGGLRFRELLRLLDCHWRPYLRSMNVLYALALSSLHRPDCVVCFTTAESTVKRRTLWRRTLDFGEVCEALGEETIYLTSRLGQEHFIAPHKNFIEDLLARCFREGHFVIVDETFSQRLHDWTQVVLLLHIYRTTKRCYYGRLVKLVAMIVLFLLSIYWFFRSTVEY